MKVRSSGVVHGGAPGRPTVVPANVVFELEDQEAFDQVTARGGVVTPADEAATKRIEQIREQRAKQAVAAPDDDVPQGVTDAEHEDHKASATRYAEQAGAQNRLAEERDTVAKGPAPKSDRK
jgi:hypothetical protein